MAARFLFGCIFFILCFFIFIFFLKLNATKRKIKFILYEYRRTAVLHMYHRHALFPGRSVYKHVCTVRNNNNKALYVVDTISVRASSRASTISTLVLSVSVLEGSREGGCRLISPPVHPPSSSSSLCVLAGGTFVRRPCCLSAAVAVRMRRGPSSWPSNRQEPMCQMSFLLVPNVRSCSLVKSNASLCPPNLSPG